MGPLPSGLAPEGPTAAGNSGQGGRFPLRGELRAGGSRHTRARPTAGGTLFQVMAGSGSPWELQGSCTLVPTSTVMSLGMLAKTGVTARQGTPS